MTQTTMDKPVPFYKEPASEFRRRALSWILTTSETAMSLDDITLEFNKQFKNHRVSQTVLARDLQVLLKREKAWSYPDPGDKRCTLWESV